MSDALQAQVKVVKEIHQPPFYLFKGSDGIVRVTNTEDSASITIKETKILVQALREITEGIPHLILTIPGKHTTNDLESRTYLASTEGMQYSLAEALVVSDTEQRDRIESNINSEHPVKPVKLFRNVSEAIEWLKNQTGKAESQKTSVPPGAEAESVSIVKEIHYPLFSMFLRSDGIMVMTTVDNAFFTIKDAQDFLDAAKHVSGGIPRLYLAIPGRHATMDHAMRKFIASAESLEFSIAEAYVIRNTFQRGIAKAFLAFENPSKPVGTFESTEDAIAWLKSQSEAGEQQALV